MKNKQICSPQCLCRTCAVKCQQGINCRECKEAGKNIHNVAMCLCYKEREKDGKLD